MTSTISVRARGAAEATRFCALDRFFRAGFLAGFFALFLAFLGAALAFLAAARLVARLAPDFRAFRFLAIVTSCGLRTILPQTLARCSTGLSTPAAARSFPIRCREWSIRVLTVVAGTPLIRAPSSIVFWR